MSLVKPSFGLKEGWPVLRHDITLYMLEMQA